MRDLRFKSRLREVVNLAADNLFPRKTQHLTGAGAGFLVIAVVVHDQDRGSTMTDDHPEKQLEFSWTVFHEPASVWRHCPCWVHEILLSFSPSLN